MADVKDLFECLIRDYIVQLCNEHLTEFNTSFTGQLQFDVFNQHRFNLHFEEVVGSIEMDISRIKAEIDDDNDYKENGNVGSVTDVCNPIFHQNTNEFIKRNKGHTEGIIHKDVQTYLFFSYIVDVHRYKLIVLINYFLHKH